MAIICRKIANESWNGANSKLINPRTSQRLVGRSFVHSFVRPFVHLSIRPSVRTSVRPSVHPFIHPCGVHFFPRRIRNEYTVLILSRWHKERGIALPPLPPASAFGSNVPLRNESARVQTRFRASDVDLVARSVKREPRYIRTEFEASFSDSNRVESELLKPSYRSRLPMLPESFERMEVTAFFFPTVPYSAFRRSIPALSVHTSRSSEISFRTFICRLLLSVNSMPVVSSSRV